MEDRQVTNPLASLLELARKARHAGSASELGFIAVNDSHALVSYRQAALWQAAEGVTCLSGVVQVEANVPYVLWLNSVCGELAKNARNPQRVGAADLPGEVGAAWPDWLPTYGAWVPLAGQAADDPETGDMSPAGGWLFARDLPWTDQEILLLGEWADSWRHAWQALHRPPRFSVGQLRAAVRSAFSIPEGRRWWQSRAARWGLVLLVVLVFPVRLSVLAPGELVPANPAVIRAPLDGVIDTFHVQPNQAVKKDQALFGFDEALLKTRLDVTRQALATAEAEYRQAAQMALSDSRSKAQLALLTGKIEEKRAEALFVADQLERARVLAPQDGVALFDDPVEWIGRPVALGERIMRIAAPGDVEVEAWVPLADAIPLAAEAGVSLYLNASPLAPVEAKLRYLAHDAVERPDGGFAYRLRATLTASTTHRVGLKGTVRVQGGWVPLIYWMLRRPLAAIRSTLGW